MNLSLFLTRLEKLRQVLKSAELRRTLLHHRVLAGAEHRQILSPELVTVIDIGTNRGQFSLAVRRWSPNAKVFAFEPLSGPSAVFRKVFAGDSKLKLFQAAISPQAGEATIHISQADDSSSLCADFRLAGTAFSGYR